jgi:hypothetical protein
MFVSANGMVVKAESAVELCGWLQLGNEAHQLLRDGMAPKDFAEALMTNKQYLTGLDFMAHALPVRDSIWWGCLCLQHALGEKLSPLDRAAATVTVRWVLRPCEENRLGTRVLAEAAGTATAAGALAAAVFHSGGNIAPKGYPFMSPDPYAHARAVAFAVRTILSRCKPEKMQETQRQYIELAMSLAEWLPQKPK